MNELPMVTLTPQLVGCPKHLSPLRESWPNGFETFSTDLMLAYDRHVGITVDDVPGIAGVLQEHPLCERVSRSDLLTAYIHSGIGQEARCQVCRQEAMGTMIKTKGPNGRIRRWRHVCFTCLVDGFDQRLN